MENSRTLDVIALLSLVSLTLWAAMNRQHWLLVAIVAAVIYYRIRETTPRP